MQYIQSTKDITLILEPKENPNWWVDSSYTVHPHMQKHSGISMTLGKGAAYYTSCKQKLNTRNSIEVELVAIDNAMAQVLWTRHSMTEKELFVPDTTIYKDNKSTKCWPRMENIK